MKTILNMTYSRATSILSLLVIALLSNPVLAQAQECGDEVDSTAKLQNYSLYYESFKNKDFASSLPYLKWMLACAPGFAGPGKNDDRNFDRAVDAYQGLSDATEDAGMKRAYLDTALVLFDTAVPVLTEAGADVNEQEWIFNKGRFIQKNAAVLEDLQGDVGALYKTVYDNEPSQLNPLSYYVNVIITDFARQDQKDAAIEFMEHVETNHGTDGDVMGIISGWRDRLFDSPEERMAFLENQLAKKPDDVKIIEELLDIYDELEELDKLSGMLATMIDVAPTPKIHIKAGVMKLNDGDPEGAIQAFNAALKMPGGDQYTKEIQFNIGNAYRETGKLPQARSAYRKALAADPSFGQALMEIANVYAEAVRDCGGSKMEREDRAVYWLVADYLDKARNVDASVRSTASRNLSQYKPYFPAAEDLFFKGWKEGEAYTIDYGCYSWIGETTKVRKP